MRGSATSAERKKKITEWSLLIIRTYGFRLRRAIRNQLAMSVFGARKESATMNFNSNEKFSI